MHEHPSSIAPHDNVYDDAKRARRESASERRHSEPDVSELKPLPPRASLLTSIRLYLRNLPEKLNKTELKRALYMLFTTYGPVLDIVTNRVGAKGQSMRGQAHVVYRDIQTSTQAMRALQGFEFFGKEMVCLPFFWFFLVFFGRHYGK